MIPAMTKKRALAPDRLAECQAAHELFLKKKAELKLSQRKLADKAGITPAAVNLYFKGINPLNAKFAAVLADEIGVSVADFSPRLAEEIRQLTKGAPVGLTATPVTPATSADLVHQMLEKHGNNLPETARKSIANAVRETAGEYQLSNVVTGDFSRSGAVGDEIRIAHYDVEGAMGGGKVVHDFPEMLQDLRVSAGQLHELGVTFEHPSHLKLMTGSGQSMEPTIRHLDPMIVNVTIREFRGDAIYAFVWQGHFYVKRLAIADAEHFTMISDNPVYPPVPIRMDETYIQAMVLIVWNARRV